MSAMEGTETGDLMPHVAGHRWATYGDTYPEDFPGDADVNWFAGVSEGYHNGPRCLDCGCAVCVHCHPEVLAESCPGSSAGGR